MNNNNWTLCFEQFNALSEMARRVLRNCAADHLCCRGFEEVGSSDISHELFAMWRLGEQNWHQVMINEVETCDLN